MTGHAALHENLGRAHGFEDVEVEGVLPNDLAGTLIRVGPGLFERFGVRVSHPFEADGVVSAVRFDGRGGAQRAARVLESAGFREEQLAGRRLYGTGAPWLRQLRNNFEQRSKNTANTSVWAWNHRLFALMEGGKPTELDPDTLELLGERDLDGVVTRAFSAHPHRVAELATSFNFGVRYGKITSLDLFALPDAGPARKLGSVELPWASLVHDFVATPTHLVFVICPARLVLWRALLGIGGFARLFRWEPERGCELIVVPLAEPDRPQRIALEEFWVWHFANGFRRGDELVFDLCRYADFSTLEAIARTSPPAPPAASRPSAPPCPPGEASAREQAVSSPPLYHRAVIDLKQARVRSEALLDAAAEFPRVHPRVEGAEHRFVWIRRGLGDREGIARLELETGAEQIWAPEPELGISEPILVTRESSDEAEVWVLSLCHDDRRERSCVVVLDGHDPSAGPLAKLWFDQTIPLTFHGTWVGAG